ncbi:MAG TPA: hypothetical protein VFN75_04705 [Pseudonocardiaceae bacterium]|nr:hypothetical protein [Pseudonocardiaceae bacterium]
MSDSIHDVPPAARPGQPALDQMDLLRLADVLEAALDRAKADTNWLHHISDNYLIPTALHRLQDLDNGHLLTALYMKDVKSILHALDPCIKVNLPLRMRMRIQLSKRRFWHYRYSDFLKMGSRLADTLRLAADQEIAAQPLPERLQTSVANRRVGRTVSGLICLAVRMLPVASRHRYSEEFRAELTDLPRHKQFAHAASLLASTFSLRRTLKKNGQLREGQRLTPDTRTSVVLAIYLGPIGVAALATLAGGDGARRVTASLQHRRGQPTSWADAAAKRAND